MPTVPILEAVSETPQPHPADASAPAAPISASADGRSGSRAGRIGVVILLSLLVGAATFVLMAIGGAF